MQSKGNMKTEREGSHLQGEERDHRRNQTCQYLGLGLPAFRTMGNKLLLSHPIGGIVL